MVILGVDIGYSNLKIAFGESGRPPKTWILPAGAGPADRMPERLGGGENDTCLYVTIDGERWAAGVPAGRLQGWERELHPEYTTTKAYRALFYAALMRTGADRIDLVVTGLPVSRFYEAKPRDDLVARLKGVHQVTPKHRISVAEVTVLPQPAGAYMDLVRSGTELDLIEEGRVVVIDPGFFSVDWVVLENGEIRNTSSGSSLQAMSVLLESIDKQLSKDYGTRVGMDRLEKAMRSGDMRILLRGEKVDITPYLRAVMKNVPRIALTAMRHSMRDESVDADLVLIAGGGAESYRCAVREIFPRSKIVVPEHAVLANVRGFWFYGS